MADRWSRRAAAVAFAALAALFASARARADPPRVAVTWRAPAGCGDGDAIANEVERLVHGSASLERVAADAEVTRGDGVVRVNLETHAQSGSGKRTVEAASCEQVASATAVILALMIDPASATRTADDASPEPEPAAVPVPVPVPESVSAAVPADHSDDRPPALGAKPPRPRAVHFAASASVAGDAGTLPGASPGGAIAVAALLGAYRVGLRGAYFPEASAALAMRPSAGADFSMWIAGLDGCRAVVNPAYLRAEVCAGLEIDRVDARGYGVSAPSSGATPFGAAALGALLDLPFTRQVSAEIRGGAAVPFTRPPFYFEALGTVHRPSPVAGRLAGGLAVHF